MTGICWSSIADRLWLVEGGTARPFEGDLEDYERQVLDGRGSANGTRSSEPQSCSRRAARRLAAERRRELEPLRQAARRAEDKIMRLTEEREALDRLLAEPPGPRDNGLALTAALKRRAELVRLIERAESEWLAAEETDRAGSRVRFRCGRVVVVSGEYYAVKSLRDLAILRLQFLGVKQDQARGSRPKAADCGDRLLHFDKLG